MFSIQSLIDTPTDLEKLRETIRDSQIAFFLPVLNESIFAMFECDDIDSEFLYDLQLMYEDKLEGGHSSYLQIEEASFKLFNQTGNKRELDQLLNESKPVIDSPYFGFLALKICLKSLARLANNRLVNAAQVNAISEFGEASEAVALARIASSFVNIVEDYSFEINKDRVLRHNRKSKVGKQNRRNRTVIESKKYRKTHDAIRIFILSMWAKEPHIPMGVIVEAVHSHVKDSELNKDEHLLPSVRNINKQLKKSGLVPKTALYNGAPTLTVITPRFNHLNYSQIVGELILEEKDTLQLPLG